MKKMQRALVALLLLVMVISGCGNNASSHTSPSTAKNQELLVVTSFYPIYIMTKNVTNGIPGVRVVDMTKPQTGCLHDYQLTPADMKTLDAAQVFIINGAGMEAFMDKVLQAHPNLTIVDSSKGIKLLKNQADGEPNPHIWVSITLAMQQVKNIGEQLAAIDPQHKNQYIANTQAYVQKLATERDKMHQAIDKLPNRDIVTFHEAFPYFAQEFNLHIVGVIEREPGSEPSAGELAQTISKLKQWKVRALFAEPQYSPKAAETIARETGAKVYTLDPAVTGPDNNDAYLQIMDKNMKALEDALK